MRLDLLTADVPKLQPFLETILQDGGKKLYSIDGVVSSIQQYISLWRKEGFTPIHTLWMKEAANLEKKITVDLQGKIQEGVFKGIDGEGALILATPQGVVKVNTGEILR